MVRNPKSCDKLNVQNLGHRYLSQKLIPLFSSSSSKSLSRHPVELEGLEETAVWQYGMTQDKKWTKTFCEKRKKINEMTITILISFESRNINEIRVKRLKWTMHLIPLNLIKSRWHSKHITFLFKTNLFLYTRYFIDYILMD